MPVNEKRLLKTVLVAFLAFVTPHSATRRKSSCPKVTYCRPHNGCGSIRWAACARTCASSPPRRRSTKFQCGGRRRCSDPRPGTSRRCVFLLQAPGGSYSPARWDPPASALDSGHTGKGPVCQARGRSSRISPRSADSSAFGASRCGLAEEVVFELSVSSKRFCPSQTKFFTPVLSCNCRRTPSPSQVMVLTVPVGNP